MGTATTKSEYARLRSYLTPTLKGPNVDAVLQSLATASSYLVNSVEAVNQNLFITTASAQYLDLLLSQYGITRPPQIGISDDAFRQIGIEVKNRKQVRDLIENLLDIVFSDEFCKATNSSTAVEPYNLNDGDTLIVSFDGKTPVTIPFQAANFTDIHAATAIEVVDAIVSYISSQGLTGLATVKNNGLGNYVELVSNTIGPRSSVTVMGGSAQNVLLFPSTVSAGGNASTQWTLSVQSDGRIRFTWSGGANPNLGKLSPGNYVNIYGGGFAASTNVGTFTIIDAVGGVSGSSYFEVYNPIGSTGIVTQGSDTAVLFFNPSKQTIQNKGYYAALYQVSTNILQIFIPATTQVIVRSRIGAAFLHDPPRGQYTFNSQPNSGDSFGITTGITLVAGTNFTIGATVLETVTNMVEAINDLGENLQGIVNSDNVVLIYNNSLSNTLTITYTGSASVVADPIQLNNISLEPNQNGPYIYDTSQNFYVGAEHSTLTQDVNASTGDVVLVKDSAGFPNGAGYVVFDYGGPTQELASIVAVPSSTSILLSPVTNLQYDHPAGQEIRVVVSESPVPIPLNGSSYPFFITDVVGGRTYAQDLINQVVAAGISVVYTVLYPNSVGLGKSDTPYDEVAWVYGGNAPSAPVYPENGLTGQG